MKLTILGSGTSVIKKDRFAPGYLIELDSGKSLLFDCGGTAIQHFANLNFDYTELDHILISHPHVDHLGGLIPLLHAIFLKTIFSSKYPRKKTLFLHGYPGFLKDYKLLRKMMAPEPIETHPIKIIEYRNQRTKYPGFALETKLVSHAVEYYENKCLGFRLEAEGKGFVYSGDTIYCQQLAGLAKDADLALFDSASTEKGLGEKGYHLTPSGAGEIAQKAGAKKLVLTHHYDIKPPQQVLKEAKKYFSGEIVVAEDLMRLKI